MSSPASRIAAGGQPQAWSETFKHPQHGDLTFTGKLPTSMQLAQHAVAMDNLFGDLAPGVEPRFSTRVLVAALAGMADDLLMDMPVIDRKEVEDEDKGSVRVVLTKYDPTTEPDVNWLTDVWMAYSTWRTSFLTPEVVAAVGEDSGSPTPSDSDTESAGPGTSPSTTPA